MNATEFYAKRDLRTLQYVGNRQPEAWRAMPIRVRVGPENCRTESGQVFIMSLANLLPRVHKRVTFEFGDPDAKTVTPQPCWIKGTTIGLATLECLQSIDPFGVFAVDGANADDGLISMSICDSRGSEDCWHFSFDRYIGRALTQGRRASVEAPSSKIGASISAILGSSIAFKTALGYSLETREVSGWNFREGREAQLGPYELPPVNVGRVMMVGAGAVGSCLAHWLSTFGVEGEWVVIDRDEIFLHNTNRSLPFIPEHTEFVGNARKKADVLAEILPNGNSETCWYDESDYAKDLGFDLVLCLANERSVRTHLSQRNTPLSFQATTGANWLSQLHRHIAGKDGCISCRMDGSEALPQLECSVVQLDSTESVKSDAALPFLSAMSGLMLYSALQQVPTANSEIRGPSNRWGFDFRSDYLICQKPGVSMCTASCSNHLPSQSVMKMYKGNRWLGLF